MIQPDADGRPEPGGEAMCYSMLGGDGSTAEDKLEKYTGEITWEFLKPQFESGSLLYVDGALDLKAVGKALVDDDVEAVTGWRESGDLVTPSEPHAAYWAANDFTFRALVVSPFVLIQQVRG